MSNTAVATKENASVKSLLRREDYQNRFKEILGARAAQFTASVVNISRDQNIAACDPNSVIAAAIVAATLDLPVDRNLGFAWIVPFKQQATFQIGHKGLIQLALRTGQYARMNARAINKEAFGGYDDVGEPRILWDKIDESKPVVGYAFAWKLVSGFAKTCYWPKERIEAHARQYSQSYRGGYNSPWKTHFDQMAIKTVIKNELSDWGILSIELQKAMHHDQGAQTDIESEVVYVDNAAGALPEGTTKPADLSDLPPTGAAKPAATPPAAAPAASDAPKAPETPPQAAEGTPASQPAAQDGDLGPQSGSPDEAKDLLASIGTIMEQNQIALPQLLAFTKANKISKDGQKIADLSTAKLKMLNKSLQNPETVKEVLKFPAA